MDKLNIESAIYKNLEIIKQKQSTSDEKTEQEEFEQDNPDELIKEISKLNQTSLQTNQKEQFFDFLAKKNFLMIFILKTPD